MSSTKRFEAGARLAWLVDTEGSYREAPPDWQLVALAELPGGRGGVGRKARIDLRPALDRKEGEIPEVVLEPGEDGVCIQSSERLLVQRYGEKLPYRPGSSDQVPYGSVVRTGGLLFAPLFEEHAASVAEGREKLPRVHAEKEGRAARSAAEPTAGPTEGSEAEASEADRLVVPSGVAAPSSFLATVWLFRPKGLLALTAAACVMGYLVGGILLADVFFLLPARGVEVTGTVRPAQSRTGGWVYEYELDDEHFLCGPNHGYSGGARTSDGVSAQITYDPSSPHRCRATAWLGRLAYDELFFAILGALIVVGWLALLVHIFVKAARLRRQDRESRLPGKP